MSRRIYQWTEFVLEVWSLLLLNTVDTPRLTSHSRTGSTARPGIEARGRARYSVES